MRILIAPDKFKGTLSAPAAALAIADGIRGVYPDAVLSSSPVADGGGGTSDTLLDASGGRKVFVTTVDPWRAPCRAAVAVLADGSVCVETAAEGRGDPMHASSEGVGRTIAQVGEMFAPATVLVGVGGTASTDGGTGVARALGWSFLDQQGRETSPGGAGLIDIHRVQPPAGEGQMKVVALCDVDSPLTGDGGSARRFGPQKGATPEQVELLERGLRNLAAVIREQLGIEVEDVPGAGAGGGLGAGLLAFLGAELTSGFAFIAQRLGLERLISNVDAVITGEGRFDPQSLEGKAPVGVARMSRRLGVPCLGVFGQLDVPKKTPLTAGFSDVIALDGSESSSALASAGALRDAVGSLFTRQPW